MNKSFTSELKRKKRRETGADRLDLAYRMAHMQAMLSGTLLTSEILVSPPKSEGEEEGRSEPPAAADAVRAASDAI